MTMGKFTDPNSPQKVKNWVSFSLIGITILVASITLVFVFCLGDSSNPSDSDNYIPPATEYQLEVISWHWSTSYGYITVEGEVKNISGQRLEDVMAVIVFRTEDREYVKSADALITYNPLMPGQTSPFTVMTTNNPLIEWATLSFKEFWGSNIPHKFSD